MSEQINQVKAQLEKLKTTQAIKQKIDDPAKEMVAQNAEHQRQKQELEDNKFCNSSSNCWNLAEITNSISISPDGHKVNSNAHIWQWQSVSAEKGFIISADSSVPVLHYFEVTKMSCKGIMHVGLSSGNISDGSFVGGFPNSFAIRYGDYDDQYWLSGKLHDFEWPNGAIKPKWNGPGDVAGCGLLLNPANEVSLFFTVNGILMGKPIPIDSTANPLYPTFSLVGKVSLEANFGDDLANPFRYDINKCPGMVYE